MEPNTNPQDDQNQTPVTPVEGEEGQDEETKPEEATPEQA
jgi:hypothetical protein